MFVAKKEIALAEGLILAAEDVLLVTDDGKDEVTLHVGESDIKMSRTEFIEKVAGSDNFEKIENFELDEEAEDDELSTADEVYAEEIGLEDDQKDEDVLDEKKELIIEAVQKPVKKLVEQILERGSVRDVLLAEIEGQNFDEAISSALKRSVKKLGGTIKRVKKVSGGKVVTVLKRVGGRKKRLTAAQKASLKKARMKAKSASSKRMRIKSMRKRSAAGL